MSRIIVEHLARFLRLASCLNEYCAAKSRIEHCRACHGTIQFLIERCRYSRDIAGLEVEQHKSSYSIEPFSNKGIMSTAAPNGQAAKPQIQPCRYKTGKTLGAGSYSVVKECVHIETGRYYAAKVINKRMMAGREHMVRYALCRPSLPRTDLGIGSGTK